VNLGYSAALWRIPSPVDRKGIVNESQLLGFGIRHCDVACWHDVLRRQHDCIRREKRQSYR
jgi:hypothetical protein